MKLTRPLKGLALVLAVILSWYVLLYLALNTKTLQEWFLKKVGKNLGMELTWQNLKFNPATGRLRGEELNLIFEKGGGNIAVKKLELGIVPRFSLLFFIPTARLSLEGVSCLSPSYDFFAEKIEGAGPLDFGLTKRWEGKMTITSLLFGLNKTPAPWNPSPGWDQSLTPLLTRHYGDTIPENRTFGYLAKGILPIRITPTEWRTDHGNLMLFGGHFQVAGGWNRKNGKIELQIKTPDPIKPALLPLGKAQIRHVFETMTISFNLDGKLKNATQGDLKGQLIAELHGNRFNPEVNNLKIENRFDFKNGLLRFPELKISLGDGTITGKGEINFAQKVLTSHLSGRNLDAQTIIRFFSRLDFSGKADLDGKISGSLKSPTFDFNINSTNADYESLHFGSLTGDFRIENQNLTLKVATLLEGTGTGSLELKINQVFKSSLQTMEMKSNFQGLPLGALLNTRAMTGSASGFMNLENRNHLLSGGGKVETSNILWYGVPIEAMKVDLAVGEQVLTLKNAHIRFNAETPVLSITKPFDIHFSPIGYHYEGWILPTVFAEGGLDYSKPELLVFKIKAQKTPLNFLAPVIPLGLEQAVTHGQFEGTYHLKDPPSSQVHAKIDSFEYRAEDKEINLIGNSSLDYKDKKIHFQNTNLKMGEGKITLNGPLGFSSGSNLKIKGLLDLRQMTNVLSWLVEGDGVADIDLTLTGEISNPLFEGKINLKNNYLFFSGMSREFSDAQGPVRFQGKRIFFDSVNSLYEDGPLKLDGWIEWAPPQIESVDLKIVGQDIPVSSPDTWQALVNSNVRLSGTGGNLKLQGDIEMVEGLFYKDYSLTEFILKPVGVIREEKKSGLEKALENMILDLNIRSAGEFEIRNNLVDMALRGNVRFAGPADSPSANGTINVVDGQIHAFGIDFENATGFATFMSSLNPLIEFTANHPIQDYDVRVRIKGYADNLSLALESAPPLNNNDIVSLIVYGQTPEQLSGAERNLFSQAAIASQVIGLLQRPLSKATKLDIVKLETDYSVAEPTPSRFSIGKKLSDRFSLSFTTDLTLEEAQKGFSIEYLMLDNLLLKGVKDAGSQYRFDLTLRFETY